MSSRGEMKISLKLMICATSVFRIQCSSGSIAGSTDVFMAEMFQQLQLPISALGQHGSAEGLHDLLDRDWLGSQLVFRRTISMASRLAHKPRDGSSCDTGCNIPDQSECTHSHWLQFRIPKSRVSSEHTARGCASPASRTANRLVISKVVPKIWARTNSAMMKESADTATRRWNKVK